MKFKRIHILIILLLCTFLLTACSGEGRYQATLITQGHHSITGKVLGDLITLGGEITIPKGAILEGSIHQLGGNIQLGGTVRGDLTNINGELILDPQAKITGDLNLGGSQTKGISESAVGGEINTGSAVQVPNARQSRNEKPIFTVLRWLISAALLGLAASSLERYLPRQTRSIGQAAVNHLPVALAVGTLSGIAGLALLVLMAYTIVLIPVALLGGAILGLAVIYGWIAWGMAFGKLLRSRLGIHLGPRRTAFSGTLLFTLILQGLFSVPLLGGLLSALAAAACLGAVYLTRFGIREFFPENRTLHRENSTISIF
jgi:hypothetical protein